MKQCVLVTAVLLALCPERAAADVLLTLTRSRSQVHESVQPEPIRVEFRMATSDENHNYGVPPWPVQIFDDVEFTYETVGRTYRVSPATDPHFVAFAEAITDGIEERVLTQLAAYLVSDPTRRFSNLFGGPPESEFFFGRELGDPVDLAGHRIDAMTVRLDSLSVQRGPFGIGGLLYSLSYTLQFEGVAVPEPALTAPCLLSLALLLRCRRQRCR